MNRDAAGDQYHGQARNQPATDRIAIGITATVDDVEGRPIRHQLNVSATLLVRAGQMPSPGS
jgi:hypothetical protein